VAAAVLRSSPSSNLPVSRHPELRLEFVHLRRVEHGEAERGSGRQSAALVVRRDVVVDRADLTVGGVAGRVDVREGVRARAIARVAVGCLVEEAAGKLAFLDGGSKDERRWKDLAVIAMIKVSGNCKPSLEREEARKG
jgi:hypothetical protein